jgi:hypothetical protein
MQDAPVVPGITEVASGSEPMQLLAMLVRLNQKNPDSVNKLLSSLAKLFTPQEPPEPRQPERTSPFFVPGQVLPQVPGQSFAPGRMPF